jgi:tetratricopeptide (TPR) repeat protein
LKEYPDWVYGWNLLGACCGQLEKYNEALFAFQKVLSFHPNDPHVYNNIGPVFQELGRLTEAVESLRKAMALNPDFAMGHLNLGIALRRQGKLREAEGSLRKALGLRPDYPEAYSNIALMYEDLGKMEGRPVSFLRRPSSWPRGIPRFSVIIPIAKNSQPRINLGSIALKGPFPKPRGRRTGLTYTSQSVKCMTIWDAMMRPLNIIARPTGLNGRDTDIIRIIFQPTSTI